MPALNNHRRELFAQLLFQGYSAAKAYEKAGYKRHDGNACTLARHPEVLERLEELRGGAEKSRGTADTAEAVPVGTRAIAARANVTVESLMDELEQARALAIDSKQASAAVSASKEKAVLRGLRIERAEVGTPGDFDHLSDEELEHALHERLVRLGYIPDTGTQH